MKTVITVGQSVQVIQIGQPEKWNKVTISREFDEYIIPSETQDKVDQLFEEIKTAHEKHSKSFVEPGNKLGGVAGDLYFNVSKNKEERM